MQNVGRYLDMSTLFDVAKRRVRYERYKAWLDRTEFLSACLPYLSRAHAVVPLRQEDGDAELHF